MLWFAKVVAKGTAILLTIPITVFLLSALEAWVTNKILGPEDK